MDDSRDNPRDDDPVEFDELVLLAMAEAGVAPIAPRPEVKQRLMARLAEATESQRRTASAEQVPAIPAGFVFDYEKNRDWQPHPVPGIRMKVLAQDRERVTMLLDVEPGARFPAHHHRGAEECYVISGSLYACGRRMEAGDFLHADAATDHDELWTEEGCRVLLIVPPEDYAAS
jgi:anti-sigma factor ChrR (cupin superfamily)